MTSFKLFLASFLFVANGAFCSFSCDTCGTIPAPTDYDTPDPIIDSPQVWSFVSEPELHPMKVTINRMDPGTSSGYIFLSPFGFSSQATYGQSGSLILDNLGNPVWFRPLSSPNLMNNDFRVQTYKGRKVLTFWQGTEATPPAYTNLPAGSSEEGSCFYILDNTYRVIKNVKAHHDYIPDIHEFLITPRNTALFLSTKVVDREIETPDGLRNVRVQNFEIQEVNIKTNKLLFFWNALDHIPLEDSYEPLPSTSDGVWDAYHLNSIGLTDSKNDIIVSSRSTWTIYRINKPSKEIIWRLGGKQSSFTIDEGAEFSWQHDARFLGRCKNLNLVSLFDDNSDGSTIIPPSHGLILKLNLSTMNASVHRTYYHDPLITTFSQGNLQSLPNGNKFVGWGQYKYYSEFLQKGNTEENPSLNLVYDAQMPDTNYSYRAYKHHWVGRPCYPPSIGLKSSNGNLSVYASWNGSTETVKWKVFAGNSRKNLRLIACAKKSGFETAIPVPNHLSFFRVKAIDANGKVIGVSKIVESL